MARAGHKQWPTTKGKEARGQLCQDARDVAEGGGPTKDPKKQFYYGLFRSQLAGAPLEYFGDVLQLQLATIPFQTHTISLVQNAYCLNAINCGNCSFLLPQEVLTL